MHPSLHFLFVILQFFNLICGIFVLELWDSIFLGHHFQFHATTLDSFFNIFQQHWILQRLSFSSVCMTILSLVDEVTWVNYGICSAVVTFLKVRMGYTSHYWLHLSKPFFSSISSCAALKGPLTLFFLHSFSCMSSSLYLSKTLPSASFQILLPPLPSSSDCDAWLSVFSKSPLVAGTGLLPLPQTEIKTQSMAAQRAAWKWKDSRERWKWKGVWMWKHIDTGQKPKSQGVENRLMES